MLRGGLSSSNFYCYGVHSNPTAGVVKNDNFCDHVASHCNREAAASDAVQASSAEFVE